jgi:O-antigen ligase
MYIAVLFIRPQEWMQFLMGVNILDYVAAVTILTTLLILPQLEFRFKAAPEHLLMLLFFFGMLMSHVADNLHWELFKKTFMDFGKIVLLYFLIVMLVNSVGRMKAIVRVMLLGCLFMTLHGIRQAFTGSGFGEFGPFIVTADNTIRIQAFGFFHDPNDLALILVTVLPYLIVGALDKRTGGGGRLLRALLMAPIVYAIYLTNSRGGWLALAAMLVTLMYLKMQRKKIALVAAGLLVAGLIAVGPSRIGTISTDEGSAHNRMILWANGNTMLKQNPFFGVGKDQFVEHSEGHQVAHNSLVHCYAELGMFGYVIWFTLLLAALKDSWAMCKVEPVNETATDISNLSVATLAAMAGYLSSSFFLSRTYIPVPYILIALIAAMRAIYTREVGPLANAFEKRDYRYGLIGAVVSIPLLYVLLRTIL